MNQNQIKNKILINAININSAGGMTVLINLINCIIKKESYLTVVFVLVISEKITHKFKPSDNLKIVAVNQFFVCPILRIFSDRFIFNNIISKNKINAILSVGNVAVPSDKPQSLIVMLPWLFYPDADDAWEKLSLNVRLTSQLRMAFIRSRLKFARIIFAQTSVAKTRINKWCNIPNYKINVIPMGPSLIANSENHPILLNKEQLKPGAKRLLVLSKYYTHKNLEILIPVAKKIKNAGLNIQIIITIDPHENHSAQNLINSISVNKVDDLIINIGTVPHSSVNSLYHVVDATLLPTLLESYSANYSDSLANGVPIFTSDRDFARIVCGDSAFYFDPNDSESIFKSIKDNIFSDHALREKIVSGIDRIKIQPDWNIIAESYLSKTLDLVDFELPLRS